MNRTIFFNPQITQIHTDFGKLLIPHFIAVLRMHYPDWRFICVNLRNLMKLLAIRLSWQKTPTNSLVMRTKVLYE